MKAKEHTLANPMRIETPDINLRTPENYANSLLNYKLERDPGLLYFRSAQDKKEPTLDQLKDRCLYAAYRGYQEDLNKFVKKLGKKAWPNEDPKILYSKLVAKIKELPDDESEDKDVALDVLYKIFKHTF
jgi:hypothetical protein